MTTLLKRETSFLFSSDPSVGATQITNNGSAFAVALDTPISIPKGALNCEVALNFAALWYVNPNVSVQLTNNQFRFTTSSAPAGTYTITFPNGLYSLEGLNSALSNLIVNLGLPANLFILSGNDATQSTVISFFNALDSVDFTIPNSLRFILGFDSLVYTAPTANYNLFSPNPAQFNADVSYLISSDLTPVGIPVNNQSNGVLANIPIPLGTAPGSQIIYQPPNLVWSDANALIGAPKQFIRFRLTNQNLVPIDTVGETYQLTVVLRWQILISNEVLPLKP